MRRPTRKALALAGALLVFVAVSALLSRALGAAGVERRAIVGVVRDQARGDERAVLARIAGCRADRRCRATVRFNAQRLRRPGDVKVLRIDPSTQFAVGPVTSVARIAWRADPPLPVVQCVTVHRTGSLLSGFTARVVAVSRPIGPEADCRGRR